jgi:hypothetical protein
MAPASFAPPVALPWSRNDAHGRRWRWRALREPDATMQPAPQDNQLMSKHRVLSLKPQLRLEWRGQDGQNETEQTDHSESLGDSITASTRIRFSVHTGIPDSFKLVIDVEHSSQHCHVVWRKARRIGVAFD